MSVFLHGFESRGSRTAVVSAWLAVPVVVLGFVFSRYVLDGRLALVISQVLFVGTATAASALLAAATSTAPPRSRGRTVWGLLTLAIGIMALSEAAYSWALLSSGPDGMAGLWVPDILNAVAALVFVAMLAVSAPVERIGRLAAARVIIDLTAIAVLSFATLYRVAVAGVVSAGSSAESFDAVRYAVYASVGLLILAGDGLLISSIPRRRLRPWDWLLALGIAIFGAGVLFWPVWNLAASGARIPESVSALVNVCYLGGYLLMGIAALQRVLAVDVPWRERPTIGSGPTWVGLAVSSFVFASVVILGLWVAVAPVGSVEERVYMTALSVSAVCMVARTTIVSVEGRRVRLNAWTDSVTGVGNRFSLERRLAELIAGGQRREVAFALALMHLDRFTSLYPDEDCEQGDSILRSVARELIDVFGESAVFRTSADAFGVVLESTSPVDAELHGRSVVRMVGANDDAAGITASVGIACWPSNAMTVEELMANATEACAWVRRHGGAHSAMYDNHLDMAVSVDRRIKQSANTQGPDMARALAAAADVRDPANYHHSRNVAALSVLLASELGFDAEHTERLQTAAMLHDVGKIALPDTMLGGRLVAVKQRHIEREHAALGQRLLEALQVEGVPLWVRSHHERWDGQGFPDGLSELSIPIEARIIALADAYDGMTAGKRYGAPMSKAAALQEIDLGIGVRFDPVLAEKFIRIIGSTKALGWADGWPAA